MQQAVPGAILLQVVEHHWALRSCIAQLAFRELACHAPPDVGPTLALQKLAAVDGRILRDVLHGIASVAGEDVGGFCRGCHDAARASGIDASPNGVSQIFCEEVALRPTQLALLAGAAGARAGVEQRPVHGVSAFHGLLACAHFATDVRTSAGQLPFLLHSSRKVCRQFDVAAIVTEY